MLYAEINVFPNIFSSEPFSFTVWSTNTNLAIRKSIRAKSWSRGRPNALHVEDCFCRAMPLLTQQQWSFVCKGSWFRPWKEHQPFSYVFSMLRAASEEHWITGKLRCVFYSSDDANSISSVVFGFGNTRTCLGENCPACKVQFTVELLN